MKKYIIIPNIRDSNSLIHGFMHFEEEGQFLVSELNKINNKYDPLDFLNKFGFYYLLEDTEKYYGFIIRFILLLKTIIDIFIVINSAQMIYNNLIEII